MLMRSYYFSILWAISAKVIAVDMPAKIIKYVDKVISSEDSNGNTTPITHPPINSLDTSKKYVASFSILALSF